MLHRLVALISPTTPDLTFSNVLWDASSRYWPALLLAVLQLYLASRRRGRGLVRRAWRGRYYLSQPMALLVAGLITVETCLDSWGYAEVTFGYLLYWFCVATFAVGSVGLILAGAWVLDRTEGRTPSVISWLTACAVVTPLADQVLVLLLLARLD